MIVQVSATDACAPMRPSTLVKIIARCEAANVAFALLARAKLIDWMRARASGRAAMQTGAQWSARNSVYVEAVMAFGARASANHLIARYSHGPLSDWCAN